MKDINKKIKTERELAGLTQQELAKMAGYKNYQTLLKIEKGKRDIKVSDLAKIAKALNLNTDYFINDEETHNAAVLWRERNDKGKCRIFENKLNGYLKNYCHLKQFLKEEYENYLPELLSKLKRNYSMVLNTNRYRFAEKLADDFRINNNMGNYPAGSLLNVIKDLGILVFVFDMEKNGSAASLVNENGASILINRNNAPWRRYFDIAHELYHILTWNMYDFSKTDNNLTEDDLEEKYANAFAASLLMPKPSVLMAAEKFHQSNGDINKRFILENALKYMVSVEAFMNRLQFLNVISESKKQELKDESIKKEYWNKFDYSEGTLPIDEYPIEYLMLVYSAYEKQRISKMKFAGYLNKNIGEIDHYITQRGL